MSAAAGVRAVVAVAARIVGAGRRFTTSIRAGAARGVGARGSRK